MTRSCLYNVEIVTGPHHPTPNKKTFISIQRKSSSAGVNTTFHNKQTLVDPSSHHPNSIPTLPGVQTQIELSSFKSYNSTFAFDISLYRLWMDNSTFQRLRPLRGSFHCWDSSRYCPFFIG
jgi:hypothetical protein